MMCEKNVDWRLAEARRCVKVGRHAGSWGFCWRYVWRKVVAPRRIARFVLSLRKKPWWKIRVARLNNKYLQSELGSYYGRFFTASEKTQVRQYWASCTRRGRIGTQSAVFGRHDAMYESAQTLKRR